MKYQYFSVAADILVLKPTRKGWEVLLIQRKNPPFQGAWALPGGFLDKKEDAITAARRELHEETGLRCRKLTEFGSFSDPERDPRGRVVTVSFYALLSARSGTPKAGDDAGEVRWFPVKRLPRLAFDHRKMIHKGFTSFERDRKLARAFSPHASMN